MRKEIYESKQLLIENCGTGRVFVRANETEIQVDESVMNGGDSMETKTKTMYQYDEDMVSVNSFSESNVLSALKDKVIGYITEYDKSDNVNAFYLGNQKVWLEFNTRDRIALRLNAEKEANNTETTLWLGTQSITLDIDKAKKMLYEIEVYASACYDNTARHKANVLALDSADKVMTYDYKTGYPDKLSF